MVMVMAVLDEQLIVEVLLELVAAARERGKGAGGGGSCSDGGGTGGEVKTYPQLACGAVTFLHVRHGE